MPIQLNKFCPKKVFFLRITVLKLILLLSVPNWLNVPPNSLGHSKVSNSVGINFVFIALSPEHYAFLFNNWPATRIPIFFRSRFGFKTAETSGRGNSRRTSRPRTYDTSLGFHFFFKVPQTCMQLLQLPQHQVPKYDYFINDVTNFTLQIFFTYIFMRSFFVIKFGSNPSNMLHHLL